MMNMDLIADAVLLTGALVAMVAMLRWDAGCLQQNGFSTRRYFQWLRHSDEYVTIKRLVAWVVLFGACSRLAASWMVVAILAVVALTLGIVMTARKSPDTLPLQPRALRVWGITMLVSVVLAAVARWLTGGMASLVTALRGAALVMLCCVSFSFVLTLAVSVLVRSDENAENT